MRGRVRLWRENGEAPMKSWGFIAVDGFNSNRADERIYFNARNARYSPVKVGDEVEVTLAEKYLHYATAGKSPRAHSVERVDHN